MILNSQLTPKTAIIREIFFRESFSFSLISYNRVETRYNKVLLIIIVYYKDLLSFIEHC